MLSRGAQRHGVRATGRPTFSLLTKHALRAAPANRIAQGPLCSSHARLASPQARAATTGICCHCPLHAPSAAGWGSRPRALRKRAARQRSPAAGASRCARCRRRTRGQKRGSAPGGGGGQHQGQAGAGVGGWLVARHGQHQRCILASQSAWLTQPASGGVKSWQLKQACPHPSAHLWPAAPAATLSQTGAASRVGPPPLLLPRAAAPPGVAAEPAARAPWRPPPGAAAGGGAPPAPLAPPRPERRGRRHVRGRGGGQGRAGPAPAGTDGVAMLRQQRARGAAGLSCWGLLPIPLAACSTAGAGASRHQARLFHDERESRSALEPAHHHGRPLQPVGRGRRAHGHVPRLAVQPIQQLHCGVHTGQRHGGAHTLPL